MPIVNDNPSPVIPPQGIGADSKISSQTYRTSLVDPREYPRGAILTNIQGNPLRVDYYSQVLGADESPAQYDPGQNAVYQQYLHISEYELRMQGGLTPSNDSATNEMTLEGTAILYPGLIPNRGDVILTDIGDGRAGIFGVTNVEQRSLFKQTAYEITFRLLRYLTQLEKTDLQQKTVEDYLFRKDFITYGRYPFITREEEVRQKSVETAIRELKQIFLFHFYSASGRCLMIPNQEYPTYDPYWAKAFTSVVNVNDDHRIGKIQLLNCGDYGLGDFKTIWDMLLEQNDDLRPLVFKKVGLLPVTRFSYNAAMKSVRWSDAEFVVSPQEDPENVDWQFKDLPLTSFGFWGTNPARTDVINIGVDNDYLFTEAFFDRDFANMTALEKLVDRYMNGQFNTTSEIMDVVAQVKTSNLLVKAYAIPILLILLIVESKRE